MLNIVLNNEARAQARLAAIIESSDDAIISKNLDGIIQTWNESAERLFEYSAKEAIGQHITFLIPPSRLDEEDLIISKIISGKKVEHFHTQRLTKSGRLIDLSLTVSPIKNKRGEVIGASKIARDVRAIKEADRLSGYLAAIVDSSDDVIISKNLDGIITSWNKSAEKVFGYTAEEAIGQHISIVIPQERLDEELVIIGKVKAGEKVDHFETVRKAKDGRLIDLSITVSPIKDSNNNIIGASKVARDITEHIRLSKELTEANTKKDEFLASVSHELRTPLNAIIGLAQILSRSDNLNEKEQHFVRTLKNSADNLLDLINDLLDFSKAEAGVIELEEIDFNLTQLIKDTAATQEVIAQQKGLSVHTVFKSPLKEFYKGDPLRLKQILNNLIGNAVKFTDDGSVSVIVDMEDQQDASVMTLQVQDTGIGISADKVGHIFDKFVQADKSITRKYGGSGLGLAITKAYVEKMNGSITVQSTESIGTTFTISIPLVNSDKGGEITIGSVEERLAKNVLIVEDYEPNRVVVTAMLDELGLSYDIALNGMQAMKMFAGHRYDAILMDIQMEVMDGLEGAARIRQYEQDNKFDSTPIIAVTAYATEQEKQRCHKAGMNDFIAKPFSLELLQTKLSSFIPSLRE